MCAGIVAWIPWCSVMRMVVRGGIATCPKSSSRKSFLDYLEGLLHRQQVGCVLATQQKRHSTVPSGQIGPPDVDAVLRRDATTLLGARGSCSPSGSSHPRTSP